MAVAAALSLAGSAFAQDVKDGLRQGRQLRRPEDVRHQDRHELEQPDRREAGPRRDPAGAHREGLDEGRDRQGGRASSCSTARPRSRRRSNTFYSGGAATAATGGAAGAGGMGWAPPPRPSPSTPSARSSWTSSTRSRRQLVFRGTAQDELSDKPEKNVKKLAKASDKMFKDFPPGSEEEVVALAQSPGRSAARTWGPAADGRTTPKEASAWTGSSRRSGRTRSWRSS